MARGPAAEENDDRLREGKRWTWTTHEYCSTARANGGAAPDVQVRVMRDVLTDLLELVGTLDDRVAGLLLTVDDLRERVGAAERWRAAQAGRAFDAALRSRR